MTHFRFRYKRVGYMRWRCRSSKHHAILLMLPLAAAKKHAPSTAAWRRAIPVFVPIAIPAFTFQIGDFTVGSETDPQLCGHPDILY